jgi:hypothetical protein
MDTGNKEAEKLDKSTPLAITKLDEKFRNEIRLINIQLQQFLPLLEITDQLKDISVFGIFIFYFNHRFVCC